MTIEYVRVAGMGDEIVYAMTGTDGAVLGRVRYLSPQEGWAIETDDFIGIEETRDAVVAAFLKHRGQ